jgi:hypothetical protein
LSVQSSHQVTFSSSLFGDDSVDDVEDAFIKYNSHSHQPVSPDDPRLIDARPGDVLYIVDNNLERVFPEGTTLSQITASAFQASQPAVKSVENELLYFLLSGEDPDNDPSVLDDARRISNVNTIQGSAQIQIADSRRGSISGDLLDNLSRYVISGYRKLFNGDSFSVYPPGFLGNARIISYQIEVVTGNNRSLPNQLEVDLLKENLVGTTQPFWTESFPITLDSGNNYFVRNTDSTVVGDTLLPNEGLRMSISDFTLSSTPSNRLDLDNFNSLAELVVESLDRSVELNYWLEAVKLIGQA